MYCFLCIHTRYPSPICLWTKTMGMRCLRLRCHPFRFCRPTTLKQRCRGDCWLLPSVEQHLASMWKLHIHSFHVFGIGC